MLWLKAFHIIFVVCWFAGLFYLPRIFVNYAAAQNQETREVLAVMSRRLYRFVTPFMWIVIALGIATLGAGEFSVDYALELTDPDIDGPKGLAIAGGVGVAAAVAQLAIFYRPPPDTAGDDG